MPKRLGSAVTMQDLALGLPDQIAGALVAAGRVPLPKSRGVSNVFVTGMGGSGISGALVQGLLAEESRIPLLCVHDYVVPATLTRQSLLVAISYSGNTEETLAAFQRGMRRRCLAVAITSGGRLGMIAAKAGVSVLPVPAGLPPRAALGYLLTSLLVALERLGVGPNRTRQFDETVGLLSRRQGSWLRRADACARVLHDRLPVVYATSQLLGAVAERWRAQFNENAKVMCHTAVFPEHNHNEIVGMGAPDFLSDRTAIVALVDRSTHARTRARLRHTLSITRGTYERALLIEAEGKSRLARLMSMVMLGDLVSVRLARLRGVDAMPVHRIDELKRRMSQTRTRG